MLLGFQGLMAVTVFNVIQVNLHHFARNSFQVRNPLHIVPLAVQIP
jgi:hypothetical protein